MIMYRIVLDTDVIIAAMRSPSGASAAILNEALTKIETTRFFTERSQRVDMDRFRKILNRDGGEPPQEGDEIPVSFD